MGEYIKENPESPKFKKIVLKTTPSLLNRIFSNLSKQLSGITEE